MPAAPRRSTVPTLREERRLLRAGHTLVAGMDEVGRGALAGPVSVGVVVVDLDVPTAPAGVRDSKLLVPAAREALVPRLRRWARAWAVGHAEPAEIDAYGDPGGPAPGRPARARRPARAARLRAPRRQPRLADAPAVPAPADEEARSRLEHRAAGGAAVPAPHVELDAEPACTR